MYLADDIRISSKFVEPGTTRPEGSGDRHAHAVARSLRWADEAAERGDHANALGWVETVLAIGDRLPEEYERKRAEWLVMTRGGGAPAQDGMRDTG